MALSRLDKLGTIFSRVTALLRSGVVPRADKPLWYDVYHVFPPKTEPSYAARRPKVEIQEILYPEDSIRSKFHRRMQKRLPVGDLLQESTDDLTRRAISLAHDLMQKDSSLSEDQVVDRVIESFRGRGLFRSRQRERAEVEYDPTEELQQLAQEGHDPTEELQQQPVKKIFDKNIDVSKFIKPD